MLSFSKIWYIFVALAIAAKYCFGAAYPYRQCRPLVLGPPKLQIYLKDGKCTKHSQCETLAGCTSLVGNIIVRDSLSPDPKTTIQASFPALREITGYLVILLVKTNLDSFEKLFPNLAVIRGKTQIVHYSLVIYRTDLKRVDLPSLTVIKSGGVRVDHNSQMCYIKTIKWASIVLDKAYTEKNFGISFYRNNEDCFDKCIENKCISPSGHDSTRQQYCYGPGNKTHAQCQKLCQASCGQQGCVDGTTDQCCHKECVGGCTAKASNHHCHACMNYRAGKNGSCVSVCPAGNYVVDNFECQPRCPTWNRLWPFYPEDRRYYAHNGKCVNQCPSGYTKNSTTKHCEKCQTNLCPKECRKNGEYKVDGISTMKGLKDCTVFNSSIVIEVRAGPSNIMEELEENLGSLQHVHGSIKVSESEVITSLNFLKNLESIGTNRKNPYALVVLSNPNLKSLWRPKKLIVGHGNILLHGNTALCPKEINSFNQTLNFSSSGALTQAQNGFLCSADLDRFNITVSEVACKKVTKDGKCVVVSWLHKNSFDSRSVFYIVNYKITKWTVGEKAIKENNCTKRWCQVDKSIPEFEVNSSRTGDLKMDQTISHLVPFTTYTFFVETYLIKSGDGRKSFPLDYSLPEAIPGNPVGLAAVYLSSSAIEVSWLPPERPNGLITEYRIYYEKQEYSFWRSDLDWCSRRLSLVVEEIGESRNTTTGSCPRNITQECEGKKLESRRVLEDKNFVLFNSKFEDELIGNVFQKVENETKKGSATTTTPTPICNGHLNQSNCIPSTVTVPSQSPTEGNTTRLPVTKKMTGTAARSSMTPTNEKIYKRVGGQTLKYIIKDLPYFQEYIIKVCPCNRAGCLDLRHCPDVFGRTDAVSAADIIPGGVIVNVNDETYSVNWTAPSKPNGVVLHYDIRTRHNQNQERRRCMLGSMPTTFTEKGAAPGNYSIRIQAISPAGNTTWTTPVYFTIEEKPSVTEDYDAVIVGVGTASAVVILLLASFLFYYRSKKSKSMSLPGVLYASANPDYLDSSDVYVPDEWEVPREKIQLVRELGKGTFGKVFEGIAHRVVEGESRTRVAVKTVNEGASIKDRIEFLQEASIMKAFNCYHIVRLLGVVSQGEPTLVVMELMERGDLKGFLRGRRPDAESDLLPPSLAELLQMAAEVADGMSYLSARKFVHRDLAARNCMVSADFTVKIGDFGMTRDVYDTDYYRKGGKGLLPVRWMAPESLYDGVFTSASDVWSYGVVLWEMATMSAQPYPGKSNEDVLSFVIDGGILEQPEGCSDRLYNMMCNCWKADPRARPSFLEIVHFLENDVSESFEEVSYYHEMKRRLFEATETDMTPVQDAFNQGRRGLADLPGTSSCSTNGDDNWMTEADRGLGCQADTCQGQTCQGIDNNLYSSSEKDIDVRYVEFPM